MKWMNNLNEDFANGAEDLSYPPSGGRLKFIALGILLPLAIFIYSSNAWITETALWITDRGRSNTIVHGQTAQCLAAAYAYIGLFIHFRYCWGLLQAYRTYTIGTILSLIGFITALLLAFGCLFA